MNVNITHGLDSGNLGSITRKSSIDQMWMSYSEEIQATWVTASWVVAGMDMVTMLFLYQGAVCKETKYRRLRLSCCNKLLTISELPSSS